VCVYVCAIYTCVCVGLILYILFIILLFYYFLILLFSYFIIFLFFYFLIFLFSYFMYYTFLYVLAYVILTLDNRCMVSGGIGRTCPLAHIRTILQRKPTLVRVNVGVLTSPKPHHV
jgi:hypothetical protein